MARLNPQKVSEHLKSVFTQKRFRVKLDSKKGWYGSMFKGHDCIDGASRYLKTLRQVPWIEDQGMIAPNGKFGG